MQLPQFSSIKKSSSFTTNKSFILFMIFGALLFLFLVTVGGIYLGRNSKPKVVQQINQQSEISPTNAVSINAAIPTYPVYHIKPSYKIISTQMTSPSKLYNISEKTLGDYTTIELTDKQKNVIANDIVKLNENVIGYNKKFGCQCETTFNGWYSNTQFILKIINGNGEEYEYLVDAINGKIDESTFQRVK